MKVIFVGVQTLVLALPLAGLAQTPPPPPPGTSPGNSASALGFSDTTNGPAALLERLQLSAAQLPFWADYVAQLDAYSKLFYSEKPMAAYGSESAVRQFAHMTYAQQNRLAALEDIESAARRLYAQLSPAQQTVADQMLLASVPQFGMSGVVSDVPSDSQARPKREPPSRRGGASGGMGGMGSMP